MTMRNNQKKPMMITVNSNKTIVDSRKSRNKINKGSKTLKDRMKS